MLERSEPDLLRILQIVNDSDIATVRLRMGDTEIFVSRVAESDAEPAGAGGTAGPGTVEPRGDAAAQDGEAHPATTAGRDGQTTVSAPMVGVFYRAPEPGAEPYVDVGTTVAEDTTVGLIEAMKVYTAVPAGMSGVIQEILVKNAEFVEFGQPLFVIAPDG